MANTNRLAVEKALEKIRSSDSSRSKSARREEEMAALDEEKAHESATAAPRG